MRRVIIVLVSSCAGLASAYASVLGVGRYATTLLGWPASVPWPYWLCRGLANDSVRRQLTLAGDWEWLRVSGAAVVIVGVVTFVLVAWLLIRLTERGDRVAGGGFRVRGRRLVESVQVAQSELARECRRVGKAASMHPALPLSEDRSRRGVLIVGSPGGGKTQIIDHILLSLLGGGQRQHVLIYDNKLDYTQSLLGLKGVGLFAPWDRRGLVWDVAADVQTRAQARDLASRLVPAPPGENAVFAEGARQILTGLIIHLQQTRPKQWSFKDIAQLSSLPYTQLRDHVVSGYPVARTVLPAEPNRTVYSMLANLGTYLADVFDLGDAWSVEGQGRRRGRFSFRRWLLVPDSVEARRVPVVIVQGHRAFAQLTRGYVQSLLGAIGGLLSDMTDSRARALWLVLDELPQLGRIDDLMPLLEVGRSKGVRPVLAAQDLAQLRAIYGRDAVEALGSMIGTYIVCRSQGQETPDWVSRLVGERTVDRATRSVNRGAGNFSGERFLGTTESHQRERQPVISPDEVSSSLGPGNRGVRALLITGGNAVYRLTWPYIRLADALQTKRVAATKPAPWIRPGWCPPRERLPVTSESDCQRSVAESSVNAKAGGVDKAAAWDEKLDAIARRLPEASVAEEGGTC